MSKSKPVNSQESSQILLTAKSCCNTTALKISLLVIGLLFAIGAVVAHVQQVNAIAYTLGAAGVSILVMAIASIVQWIKRKPSGQEETKDPEVKAPQFEPDTPEMFDKTWKETIQDMNLQAPEFFDQYIVSLHQALIKYTKIIKDPAEPLEVSTFYAVVNKMFAGDPQDVSEMSHQDKQNAFWTDLKCRFAYVDTYNCYVSENEKLIQKKQEITTLQNELLQLRQTSYHDFIQTLSEDKLLEEARLYYQRSYFLINMHTPEGEDSPTQMTLETLVPKLRDNMLQAQKNYDLVEMHEIIKRFENRTI